MPPADVQELRETVRRMEKNLREKDGLSTQKLMRLYELLVERFRIDLANERDELLSRSGALMLIQSALSSG